MACGCLNDFSTMGTMDHEFITKLAKLTKSAKHFFEVFVIFALIVMNRDRDSDR